MPIQTPNGWVLTVGEAGQILFDRMRERSEVDLNEVLINAGPFGRNTGKVIEGEYRVIEEERPALTGGTT
jgi:hypothetical protein